MTKQPLKDFSVRALSQSSALQGLNGSNRFRENIGTLGSRASFSDEVNKDEPNIYEFRLRRRATVELTLENEESLGFLDLFGTKKRVQAQLQDSSRNTLRSTERIRPEDEDDFKVRLNPGTYRVRITGRSENDVEYKLKLRLSNSSDFDDDDDFDDD
jgi:hypothetical protein